METCTYRHTCCVWCVGTHLHTVIYIGVCVPNESMYFVEAPFSLVSIVEGRVREGTPATHSLLFFFHAIGTVPDTKMLTNGSVAYRVNYLIVDCFVVSFVTDTKASCSSELTVSLFVFLLLMLMLPCIFACFVVVLDILVHVFAIGLVGGNAAPPLPLPPCCTISDLKTSIKYASFVWYFAIFVAM